MSVKYKYCTRVFFTLKCFRKACFSVESKILFYKKVTIMFLYLAKRLVAVFSAVGLEQKKCSLKMPASGIHYIGSILLEYVNVSHKGS